MGVSDDAVEVSYPTVVATLGRDYEGAWRDATDSALTRVRQIPADDGSFGPVPAARQFGKVYQAAATTYEATLAGIGRDLQDAAGALAAAAREMSRLDEDAGSGFTALLARWADPSGFENTRAHDRATASDQVRQDAGALDDLDGDGVVDAFDSAADPAGSGPPAPPAEDATEETTEEAIVDPAVGS
ncbi:MAG: hypothetical protein ACRCY8_17890 [Dermatophilaceae bacterium]